MAFTAVQGQVPWLALWLVLGNLLWVLAYDTEYAMVDRDDDLKLGMKTSAITLGRFDVAAIVAFYLGFVLFWALALSPLALGALFYIAIVVVLAQVAWHWRLIRGRTREGCFKAFRENHWIGFTFFGIINIVDVLADNQYRTGRFWGFRGSLAICLGWFVEFLLIYHPSCTEPFPVLHLKSKAE